MAKQERCFTINRNLDELMIARIIRTYGNPFALATSSIASHPPQVISTMAEYPLDRALSQALSYDSISSSVGSTERLARSKSYFRTPLEF